MTFAKRSRSTEISLSPMGSGPFTQVSDHPPEELEPVAGKNGGLISSNHALRKGFQLARAAELRPERSPAQGSESVAPRST